jgi:hypothetical protein
MHYGILAADMGLDELRRRLAGVLGDFADQGPIKNIEDVPSSDPAGLVFPAGELNGKAYLLDQYVLMSGSQPDLIVQLASEGDPALVVGVGAETTSGTFYLAAARGAELVRAYFNCHSDLTHPFERGEPLPVEAATGLEDLNGEGLTSALVDFGFDVDAWQRAGPFRQLLFSGVPTLNGPIAAAMEQHRSANLVDTTGENRPVVAVGGLSRGERLMFRLLDRLFNRGRKGRVVFEDPYRRKGR